MRLWTIHPSYLDTKGLTAAWREGLLAQKVLAGGTRGYKHHPQLARFRAHPQPLDAVASFLTVICEEATRRGYRFDASKIAKKKCGTRIHETRGQLLYELKHLRAKLKARAPEMYRRLRRVSRPEAHPLFRIVAGGIRDWERRAPAGR